MIKLKIQDKKTFYAGLAYFVGVLLFIAFRLIWGTGFAQGLDSSISDLLFSTCVQLFALVGIPFLIFYLTTKPTKTQIKETFFIKPINKKSILWSILLGVCVYVIILFISSIWSSFIGIFGYTPSGSSTISDLPVWLSFIIAIVATCILPGVCEEGSHRGLLLGNITKNGMKRAILISALLFGLMHLNVAQCAYAFVTGIILATVTLTTRSIFPAMIIHGTSNFIATYFSYATIYGWWGGNLSTGITQFASNTNIFASFIVASLILFCVLFALVYFFSKLYSATKLQHFEQFVKRFKKNVEGTEVAKDLDLEDTGVMLHLYMQTAFTKTEQQLKEIKDDKDTAIDMSLGKLGVLPDEIQKVQKIHTLDYFFYYCAIVLGSIITLATFIWGII